MRDGRRDDSGWGGVWVPTSRTHTDAPHDSGGGAGCGGVGTRASAKCRTILVARGSFVSEWELSDDRRLWNVETEYPKGAWGGGGGREREGQMCLAKNISMAPADTAMARRAASAALPWTPGVPGGMDAQYAMALPGAGEGWATWKDGKDGGRAGGE